MVRLEFVCEFSFKHLENRWCTLHKQVTLKFVTKMKRKKQREVNVNGERMKCNKTHRRIFIILSHNELHLHVGLRKSWFKHLKKTLTSTIFQS